MLYKGEITIKNIDNCVKYITNIDFNDMICKSKGMCLQIDNECKDKILEVLKSELLKIYSFEN